MHTMQMKNYINFLVGNTTVLSESTALLRVFTLQWSQ